MTRSLVVLSVAVVCVTSFALAATPTTQPAAGKPAATQPDIFKTQMEKVSYAMGMGLGTNAKRQNVDIDVDMFVKGFKDAEAGKPLLTEQQVQETMMAFMQEMQSKAREKQAKEGEANKKEGEEFLAKMAKEPGVQTLPSGLEYKVVKEGEGPSPTPNDRVEVKYTGKLIDGTEFDSSGEGTRTFSVSGVVPGFSEALQKMKVGSEWIVYIPSNLAYGAQQMGPKIGPNSTLIFNITLEKIEPPATQPAGAAMPHMPPGHPMVSPTTRPAGK